MSIEIKDVRLILPALVSLKHNDQDISLFVYVDQAKLDVVIPDPGEIDVAEFKQAFFKYYTSKNPVPKTPNLPNKDIFKKMDPSSFKGDFHE